MVDLGRTVEPSPTIDRLLDQAVQAINRGDSELAHELAGQVLATDAGNLDAGDLLAAPTGQGEIRRLTIMFCDLVDSTVLSTQVGPETYRTVVGRYRQQVHAAVERYEGHIGSTKGDGILAVFGHPQPHENDVRRAVQAGVDIVEAVERLSTRTRSSFAVEVAVRVGIHRGIVYLDTEEDDVYGFAANLAARLQGLARAGEVVVSDVVATLVGQDFELVTRPATPVKGVPEPVAHHVVTGVRKVAFDQGVASAGPLIGREGEWNQLVATWDAALRGDDELGGVALRGGPGIGKTRLAVALARHALRSGAEIVELLGSPFHTDTGLHPVRVLIERRCGIERDQDAAERLHRLEREVLALGLEPLEVVPLLAPVLGVSPQTGYDPAAADGRKLHDRIVDIVEGYLSECLGRGPSLLLVEDYQWLDDSTREVVRRFMQNGAADAPRVVLVTTRPGVSVPGGSRVLTIDLEPLDEKDTDALIEALDPSLSPEAHREIKRRADGIPLFVEQLVASVDTAHDRAESGVEHTGVPDALYEPLFAQLRASAKAVPVAAAAATIGRDVDTRLLAEVVDLDDDEVAVVIDELERALVLERSSTPGSWRFRHEMLREVAYELQPPSARRELHGRVADGLVGRSPSDVADWRIVAGHYQRAGRFHEAADAFERAADDARRRGALAEARAHLTRAIEQFEQADPGSERDRREVAVRLARGSLAVAAEGSSSPEAALDFERCLQLSSTDVRGDEMFGTLIAVWGYYASRADLDRAEQVLATLRVTVDEDRDYFRPESDSGFGTVAWFRGDFTSARDRLEHSVRILGEVKRGDEIDALWYVPSDPVASIYTHVALARFIEGDLSGTSAALAEVASIAAVLGFPKGPYTLAYARSFDVWMRIERGDLVGAGRLADELAELADRHGFDSWSLVGGTQRTTVAALSHLASDGADPATTTMHAEMMTNLVNTWRMLEVRVFLTFYDAVVGQLWTGAGELDRARQVFDEALVFADETGMHFYDAELLRLRAGTNLDDADQRAASITDALVLAQEQGAHIFELRAALDLVRLRAAGSRDLLIDAMSRFPGGSSWPELHFARGHLA